MKPFTVPGLLRAAASYIEIHGHEQRLEGHGGLCNRDGPCCPGVAFHRIASNNSVHGEAFYALELALGERVIRWSDRTPTAEVLATMRRVARELDAQ